MSLANLESVTGKIVLISLRLKNIALLNSQDLPFDKGFTVITGETGAGKSIFLDSLDALFAGSKSPKTIRLFNTDENLSSIEALFSITPSIEALFEKFKIDLEDNEFLISREWSFKDARLKSKSRINGIYVNQNQILELRQYLIDFTSQGFSYKINTPSKQIEYLDQFAFTSLKPSLLEVKKCWILWLNTYNKLKIIKNEYENLKNKYQEMNQILDELEIANLIDPLEEQKLQNEQDRLSNSVALQFGFNKLLSRLNYGSDEFPSTLDQISNSAHELRILSKDDKALYDYYEEAINIHDSCKNFIRSLEEYTYSLESDPNRLNVVQERLLFLKKLQNRYGLNLSQLIKKRNELRESLANLDLENNVKTFEKKELMARLERDKKNDILSQLRRNAAKEFEKKLMQYLRPLGLSNVRFQIQISNSEPHVKGSDSIQFLFSANPGEPLLPLNEIASGGEMSRFSLALKTLFSSIDNPKTFIFDEIDSGVSGRVSRAVTSLLKDLSLTNQVLCVTHQPLVAAAADQHIVISKSVIEGKTSSKVKYLNDFSERQNELAELAGGDIGEAKLYAASLLEQQAA